MSAITGASSGLKNTGYDLVSIANKTPQQSALSQGVTSRAQGGINSSVDYMTRLVQGDPEMFAQLEAPALRQFGQLQGNIASRFSGMGSGARRSSGFQNTMGAAGEDLAERLQGQRMNLQQGASQSMMNLYSQLMGEDHFDSMLTPKKKSFFQELMLGAIPGLSEGASQGGTLAILKKLGLLG